jgi:hypothetical protein
VTSTSSTLSSTFGGGEPPLDGVTWKRDGKGDRKTVESRKSSTNRKFHIVPPRLQQLQDTCDLQMKIRGFCAFNAQGAQNTIRDKTVQFDF